jgi:hypothetical protein
VITAKELSRAGEVVRADLKKVQQRLYGLLCAGHAIS